MKLQDVQIVFAQQEDEDQLSNILAEYGMGIPGRIEEQLVVKANGQVLAGAKVVQISDNHFFLEVIGVRQDLRGQGIGRLLLGEILQNPWRSCRGAHPGGQFPGNFQITTLARGGASEFYRRMGFGPCRMEELPEDYREQCDFCPDKQECNPVPMLYTGGESR